MTDKKETTSSDLIKKLIPTLEWFDYEQLDSASKANYWNDAKALRKNPVFKNEIQAFISSIIKHIAYVTKSHEETMASRTLIVGMEAFRERIEAIEDPNKEITTDQVNEPI
jgi:hypothetical protein